jgi:hypothetical protein
MTGRLLVEARSGERSDSTCHEAKLDMGIVEGK